MFYQIIVAVICVLFSSLSYILFGREEKIFNSIQTEPPRGLNPLEIALIYNKKALPGDAVALLHFLSSKDYLEMTKDNKTGEIVLAKLKNYDGNNVAEKFIFETVFRERNSISLSDMKKDPSISFSFRIGAMAVNSKSNSSLYFSGLSLKLKSYSKIINFIGLALVNILVHIGGILQPISSPFIVTLFQGIGLFIIGSGSEIEIGFGENERVGRGKDRVKDNIGICAFLMSFFSIVVIILIFTQNVELSTISKVMLSTGYVFSLILLCISQLITTLIDKKTKLGMEIYQELAGFKNYIDKVERPRLEALFNENPRVFRKLISFGFVLGISKKWTDSLDATVFNSIFSTAYGHSNDIDSNEDMTNVERQAAYEEFQKNIRINRNTLQSRIDDFNNMINTNDLTLFGKVYKEPLKMPPTVLSKHFSGDK